MIACELGKAENVMALLDHFEMRKRSKNEEKKKAKRDDIMRKKGKGKKLRKRKDSDESDEDMEDDENDEEEFDVNYLELKDKSSWTALQYAAYHGHHKIVEVLCDAGADVNTKNSKSFVKISSLIRSL